MIRVSDLAGTWGTFSLKGIDLHVESGEYFLIVGPSGSGKTLLLETIAGLHRPERGRIWMDEREVTDLAPERRKVSVVYQERCLFPHLSVRGNVGYGLRYSGLSRARAAARVEEMISLFDLQDLAERLGIVGLSGGETQKVALARALAVDPRVLFLDEPLGALDYGGRAQVAEVLKNINERFGITTIHVSHDYTEAMTLAHRVAVMRDGRIVQVGTPAEVFWRPNSRFVADFLGVENVLPAEGVASPDGPGARVGDLTFRLAQDPGATRFYLCVRPEDIFLTREPRPGPNTFQAQPKEIVQEGFQARITLALGQVDLVARVPLRSVREHNFTVASPLHVAVEPSALHTMTDDEEG